MQRMRFFMLRERQREGMRLRLRSYFCKAIRMLRWQRMQSVCIAYKYAEKEVDRGAKRAMPDPS